jgi:hypothetical protein
VLERELAARCGKLADAGEHAAALRADSTVSLKASTSGRSSSNTRVCCVQERLELLGDVHDDAAMFVVTAPAGQAW